MSDAPRRRHAIAHTATTRRPPTRVALRGGRHAAPADHILLGGAAMLARAARGRGRDDDALWIVAHAIWDRAALAASSAGARGGRGGRRAAAAAAAGRLVSPAVRVADRAPSSAENHNPIHKTHASLGGVRRRGAAGSWRSRDGGNARSGRRRDDDGDGRRTLRRGRRAARSHARAACLHTSAADAATAAATATRNRAPPAPFPRGVRGKAESCHARRVACGVLGRRA